MRAESDGQDAARPVAAAAAGGTELELRPGEAEQVERQIARAFRLVRPLVDDEAPECGGAAFLASSLAAYALDRLPGARGPAAAWCRVLSEVLADAATVLDEDDNEDAVRRVIEELVRKGVLVAPRPQLEVGSPVLALLTEDDDWHEAVVERALGDRSFRVVFLEYGKPQDTAEKDIRAIDTVLDDEGAEGNLQEGTCEMCSRQLLLTFHHLIPKDTHPTYLKKRLPAGIEGEPTRHFLNSYGTMVCRHCHAYVHRLASNEVLAKEYNTLEKILATPSVQRYVQWAGQQVSP